MAAPRVDLTFFPALTNPQGQRVRTTWPSLLARLTRPRIVADKHQAPGLSLATFKGDRRGADRVEQVFAVGLDFDRACDWDALLERFAETDAFMHTTFSSTPEDVRARAFLRLSRPVSGAEYRRVWQAVADVCRGVGLEVDGNAKDPSRFWFLPSIPPGGSFRFSVGQGRPVNVEWALAQVPAQAPAPPPRPLPASSAPDVVDRARAYLAKCGPAISGQGGHAHTFFVAQKLVRGFLLDEATALALLSEWNQACQPPWSERDLRRKVREAATRGRMPEGELVDKPRRAS